MCGINGILGRGIQNKSILLKKMNDLIIHRGPNAEGVYENEFASIGMRRLSIIDLDTGNQPIFNEDKSLLVVLNGEIYNYKSLRTEMESKGHKFSTNSDTEVIVHLFEEYGEKCLDKISGMFAFAIYDINKNELFISRDRIGEKPVYYYIDRELFVFSSELKSIVESFDFLKKDINIKALNQYLQLTYIPAPLTIFQNIYKLQAGYFMKYRDKKIYLKKYWDIKFNNSINENYTILSYENYKSKLRKTLFETVEEQMVSDVPIGAFLSGGVDSGIITGIMSKISPNPINTYTIGFDNIEYDESKSAKITSEFNKTNHNHLLLNYDNSFNEIEKIIDNMDEPFADSSQIPTYFVSQFASKNVKVVLTGDGGDELFGGYEKYLMDFYTDKYNKIPKFIRKSIIEKAIDNIKDKSSFSRKVRKVINYSELDEYERAISYMKLGFQSDIKTILNSNYLDENSDNFIEEYYKKPKNNKLNKLLYTDLKVVLEGDMLVKVDRMSMLNSIETRVPMLGREMVEFAYKIPSEYKIKGNNKKIILKDTFSDLLPPEILKQKKKGFMVPISDWFKNRMKDELLEIFKEEKIKSQGIFNYEYIKKLLEDHFNEKSNNFSKIWTLYIFQKWYKKYFKS